MRYILVNAGERNGPRTLPMVTSIKVAYSQLRAWISYTESLPLAALVITTLELIVVGIHPMTTSPTKMTVSILSVPDATIAETNPKTSDENI